MATFSTSCVASVILVTMVTAYPSGPFITDHVCQDMFPVGHNSDAQDSNPMFEIKLSMYLYGPWEMVNVTLRSTGDRPFLGYFLQARRANCSHPDRQEGVGYFEPHSADMQPIDCLNHQKSAVAHTSSKRKTVQSVTWYAPGTKIGPIYFKATVVVSKDVFWTNVFSPVIRDISHPGQGEICPSRKLLDPTQSNSTTPKPGPDPTPLPSNGASAGYIQWFLLLTAFYTSGIVFR